MTQVESRMQPGFRPRSKAKSERDLKVRAKDVNVFDGVWNSVWTEGHGATRGYESLKERGFPSTSLKKATEDPVLCSSNSKIPPYPAPTASTGGTQLLTRHSQNSVCFYLGHPDTPYPLGSAGI